MDFDITVNGLSFVATYDDEAVEQVFKPLISRWVKMWRDKSERLAVLMAAPPGAGKTTLTLMLERLCAQMGEDTGDTANWPHLQAIGMDGFHFPNSYLETHETVIDGQTVLLRSIKGAPQSFDVETLKAAIKDLQSDKPAPWPVYSRVLHDPVPASCVITGDIVLVEGNYLLLDRPIWRELIQSADDTVFIQADPNMLRERLVDRKVAGGTDQADAEAWYEVVDGKNVSIVLGESIRANVTIALDDSGYTTVREQQ